MGLFRFRPCCGVAPFEGCGYESVVVCLGYVGEAICRPGLERRSYSMALVGLSELLVDLGYTGGTILWPGLC